MRYQTPKGTFDLFPPEIEKWQEVERVACEVAELFGYREIRTPVFEYTEIFSRGIGEATDIVEKEMYTFRDRGGRSLTLKPEWTAPVVRAFIQHNLDKQEGVFRFYYTGPIFRYERPQAGRYRQSHQFGVEALGSLSPLLDAEVIALAMEFYQRLSISGLKVDLNSIGCGSENCRVKYKKLLVEYLEQNEKELCDDCRRRISQNPLRVFDCKKRGCREVVKKAPLILENLCPDCAGHFAEVKEALGDLDIPYRVNPGIVRGLDYYTRTVFELVSEHLGAQNALCGGGRYDDLVEVLGGRATPAVGFAAGIERAVLVRDKQIGESREGSPIPLMLFPMGERAEKSCAQLALKLRKAGVKTCLEIKKSVKAALRNAVKNRVKLFLILGEDELKEEKIAVKNLETEKQIFIPRREFNSLLENFSGDNLVAEILAFFEN